MKTFHLIVSLLFCTACLANDIDRLQTNEDVCNFLIKKISKKFKEHPLLKTGLQEADTAVFGRNKFFKTDIDNNKQTDLIIYGSNLVIILDKGGNNYEVRYLDGGAFQQNNATLISIDTAGLPRKIIIRQFERQKEYYDTLVYLFNSFIEYNPRPDATLHFEKIVFRTSRCFGECPVFEMTVNSDRTATYNAVLYNEKTGGFTGTIPEKDFEELLLFLKYLQIDKIKNSYSVNQRDAQTARIEISYNGKSKTINDYGEIGTFGLNTLYLRFFRWRTSIDWIE